GGAVPALLQDALEYPAAAHWQGPFALEPSMGWTFGLVAQLTWHGACHPWLEQAREACRRSLDGEATDEVHRLLYLVRYAGEVLPGAERERALARLCGMLGGAPLYVMETPVRRYGLTPLHFAPAPDAP